ncbi:hypothetical protein GGX14DRAFT_667774 [Mycena pura]|uniref:Uncharacterized protein n=1 Tax=Mycena pura TaxID=153505 RepID=A0AAD6V1W6_9AGAR|nr:hypothetical protein GGX14DRAFT_618511 [Mycena pura]KAJ7197638.1 hypothetical protein GGX14DRAFT_667774 [Mycena pura]
MGAGDTMQDRVSPLLPLLLRVALHLDLVPRAAADNGDVAAAAWTPQRPLPLALHRSDAQRSGCASSSPYKRSGSAGMGSSMWARAACGADAGTHADRGRLEKGDGEREEGCGAARLDGKGWRGGADVVNLGKTVVADTCGAHGGVGGVEWGEWGVVWRVEAVRVRAGACSSGAGADSDTGVRVRLRGQARAGACGRRFGGRDGRGQGAATRALVECPSVRVRAGGRARGCGRDHTGTRRRVPVCAGAGAGSSTRVRVRVPGAGSGTGVTCVRGRTGLPHGHSSALPVRVRARGRGTGPRGCHTGTRRVPLLLQAVLDGTQFLVLYFELLFGFAERVNVVFLGNADLCVGGCDLFHVTKSSSSKGELVFKCFSLSELGGRQGAGNNLHVDRFLDFSFLLLGAGFSAQT